MATSYKFLFIRLFLSIKYSALVCFFVRYATFIPVFANINIYQCVTLDCEIETGRGNGA
ncbi:hypothetical protein [Klebsiella pneumoniae IS43]|uniref:Uncharacterized protein n=1 Tax=Klebsiella pneumoniae IS43 TaxID=1432552 RepID=W1DTG8_KLEPN|nr:hypothetical protein [Klebsiella pneumoniae IS43]